MEPECSTVQIDPNQLDLYLGHHAVANSIANYDPTQLRLDDEGKFFFLNICIFGNHGLIDSHYAFFRFSLNTNATLSMQPTVGSATLMADLVASFTAWTTEFGAWTIELNQWTIEENDFYLTDHHARNEAALADLMNPDPDTDYLVEECNDDDFCQAHDLDPAEVLEPEVGEKRFPTWYVNMAKI